jgi:hypothetical protein
VCRIDKNKDLDSIIQIPTLGKYEGKVKPAKVEKQYGELQVKFKQKFNKENQQWKAKFP